MTTPQGQGQGQGQGPAYWRAVAEEVARQTFGANSPLVPVFLAMIQQESGFNPSAYNQRSGASGIAQFIPATAKGLGINPWDPNQALWGAARHLKDLLGMFDGDVAKAVAAYNAGPKTIQDAVKMAGDNWPNAPVVMPETRKYLQAVFGQGAAPDSEGSGATLGAIISSILGGGGAADRNSPLVEQLKALQQQAATLNARIDELSKKPSLTQDEQNLLIFLRMQRDETVAKIAELARALKPAAGESPANLIQAIANVGTLGLSIAHTAFADQMTALNFVLDVIKENNKLAQDRFANLLALHRATTEDLQAIVAARHLLQADQLAIAAQALARAGFIAQQRAWNATHLFWSATGTQPGFGLDDPPARALAAMGLAPPPGWGRTPAVNPEDFDPIRILEEAQRTLTGTTGPIVSKVPTEEDYGIPQLVAQAAQAAQLAGEVPAATPISPPSVAVPNYDAVLAQVFGPVAQAIGKGAGAGEGSDTGAASGQGQGQGEGEGQEQGQGQTPGTATGPAMPSYAPSGRGDRWEREQGTSSGTGSGASETGGSEKRAWLVPLPEMTRSMPGAAGTSQGLVPIPPAEWNGASNLDEELIRLFASRFGRYRSAQ